MSTKTATKSTKSSGCRCGCAGKAPSGGSNRCTCDQCQPACPDSGVLRPSFFAGQLLTEDDLQQITAYQIGKRRLTNRYLFGTGVVCGLEVVKSDRPGCVTVNCGYALDCCGNDIFLSCPVTIDINEKIRDLPCDCGEPCDDGSRRYQLCVSYAEIPSEPVSAYSPGATSTCMNTRVQESCTFTLRCLPKECKPPDDFSSRITDVLKDCRRDEVTDLDLAVFQNLYAYKDDLIPVKPITLAEKDFKDLWAASGATPLALKEGMKDEELQAAVTSLLPPARAFARVQYFDPAKITQTIISKDTFSGPDDLKAKLSKVGADLKEAIAKLLPEHQHDASVSLETALRIALLKHEIDLWTEADSTKLAKARQRIDVRLFVLPHDSEPYNFDRYKAVLGELSQQFVDLPIPTGDEFTSDELKAAGPLGARYKKEGINGCVEALCKIVNPPCPPCDDLCVLLATIEIKVCKVQLICTQVRNIILSPAALGYWLPLHDLLAKLCCCPKDGGGRPVLDATLDPFKQAQTVLFPPPPSNKTTEGAKP